MRHALVREQERHVIAPLFQLVKRSERLVAGGGAEHAVVLPVAAAEVACDRAEDVGVVVDDNDGGL